MNNQQPPKARKMPAKTARNQPGVRLGPEIRSRIGRQLRAMYDDVVNQGVPDRFEELLRNIDATTTKKDE